MYIGTISDVVFLETKLRSHVACVSLAFTDRTSFLKWLHQSELSPQCREVLFAPYSCQHLTLHVFFILAYVFYILKFYHIFKYTFISNTGLIPSTLFMDQCPVMVKGRGRLSEAMSHAMQGHAREMESQWRVLTKCHPLEERMANYPSILAVRAP